MAEALSAARQADVVVFPELSLTGYGLGGRVREMGVALAPDAPVPEALTAVASAGPAALLGLVEEAGDTRLYNASVMVRDGMVVHRDRKRYLPTYGMFDEGRHFAPGREPPGLVDLPGGWRAGVLICEDFWHPSLSWLVAMQGADLLVVMSAAPGRGGSDPDGTGFDSMERWTLLCRATAVQYGLFVALVNRVGCEGGITFGGGSLLVDPEGEVQARSGGLAPERLDLTLDPEKLVRARRPFFHGRDEDPALLLRGIRALLRER
jgi:predicted amidohydrolase